MANSDQTGQGKGRALLRKLVVGVSLGTIATVGSGTAVHAQNDSAYESCSFALNLKSASAINRVLETFPNDPCVPVMLASLSPRELSRIDRDLVAALPRAQLRKVPREVLAQLDLPANLGSSTSPGNSGQQRPRAPRVNSQY